MTSVGISSGARIHLGLLDMGGFSPRKYGGIGCTLEEPQVRVIAHTTTAATDVQSSATVASGLLSRVLEVVGRFLDEQKALPVRIEVTNAFNGHVGLGLGTSLTLASLKAAALARSLTVTDTELILAARRGGTSGIGCNGFFSGGWTVDAGQPQDGRYVPSSASDARVPSLKIAHVDASDWDVALFYPPGLQLSGEAELRFFRNATPVPGSEVARAFPTLYHGLLPALLEKNIESFGRSLDVWNGLGFKKREIGAQSPEVRRVLSVLRGYAPAVGMSSLGPTVFAFDEMGRDWSDVARVLNMSPVVTRVAARGWSAF